MFALRVAAGCALAVVLSVAGPAAALKLNRQSANHPSGVKNQHLHQTHLSHLHQAIRDLKAAQGAVTANNPGQAHKDVAAAIHQIEQAIRHHHKRNLGQTRTGLSGALTTAAHHHHHDLLQRALADARAAEKQIQHGHAGKAIKDIHGAERHVHAAIVSHRV